MQRNRRCHALSCRLSDLEAIAAPNGLECNQASPLSDNCPRAYEVDINYNRNSDTSSFDPYELQFSAGSIVVWTNGDIEKGYDLAVNTNPIRGMPETLFEVSLNDRRSPGHTANFEFENPGSYGITITTPSRVRGEPPTLWDTMIITVQ